MYEIEVTDTFGGDTQAQSARRKCGMDADMIKQRRAAFMASVRGIDAWTVARAVNRLTPGIDWRGCSKGHIADQYANPRMYKCMEFISLERLAEIVKNGN